MVTKVYIYVQREVRPGILIADKEKATWTLTTDPSILPLQSSEKMLNQIENLSTNNAGAQTLAPGFGKSSNNSEDVLQVWRSLGAVYRSVRALDYSYSSERIAHDNCQI